jgi:DnaJ family protein A protein 2
MEPGDVVIQVQEQPHKLFKRKGADLLFEKEITLVEALTGVDFVLTHLDGRKIRIKNDPGQVIKPEDIKTVEGFGMPFHKTSYKFGNLFVLFKIKFPNNLNEAQVSGIAKALASTKKSQDADMETSETINLQDFTEGHKNTHHEGGTSGQGDDDEDDDDEGHGHGQKVKCAQQ